MAKFAGLPAFFDPELYERQEEPPPRLIDVVDDGTTLLGIMVCKKTRKAGDAPDGGAPDAGVGTITCWRCNQRPDGNWDCFKIDCPPSWPPPTHVDDVLLSQ